MREKVTHTHILRILWTINLDLVIQSAVYSFIVEEETAMLVCDFVMTTHSTFQPLHVQFEGLMAKGQLYKLKNTYTQTAVEGITPSPPIQMVTSGWSLKTNSHNGRTRDSYV